MQTIVFAARKGGSSKTTLAAHLAVAAAAKRAVTLIDADPQQSLTFWWNDREADTPALLDVPITRLEAEIQKAAAQPGLVMIDTPPLDAHVIAGVIAVADLVVIPVKPSPHDLRGVSVTAELAKQAGKPFVFVITQAIPRASLTAQAALVLSQFGPVSTTIMHNRVDYAGAMTNGLTAQEIDPHGKASAEIGAIWQYISTQIKKNSKA